MSNRSYYEHELAALDESLRSMGRAAADAFENAIEALCTADTIAAAQVVKDDTKIDALEQDIEHRCMMLLLRQQPVAGDLRRISTALKVVTDLERIGDHAADIAELVPHLAAARSEHDATLSRVVTMAHAAHTMVTDSLEAFLTEDEAAARAVIDADDVVDGMFNDLKRELGAHIAAQPDKIDTALDMLMVVKYLERLGDHSVNVAEWVQFLKTGYYKGQQIV